ncbi:MAG: rhodanese-like domain-containing protein [Bacteroidetes bacterium]|nr:rhodanese-like domain-containing protein [Bacteroidota bacterium]
MIEIEVYKIDGLCHISARNALKLRRAIFIDLCPDFESQGRYLDVPLFISIPYPEFEKEYMKLDKDKTYILLDVVGIHSKKYCSFLKDKGFDNVYNLIGGFTDWRKKGFPTRTDPNVEFISPCGC